MEVLQGRKTQKNFSLYCDFTTFEVVFFFRVILRQKWRRLFRIREGQKEVVVFVHLVKKMVASASVLWGCRASNTYFRSCAPVSSGRPDEVICDAKTHNEKRGTRVINFQSILADVHIYIAHHFVEYINIHNYTHTYIYKNI